MIKNMCLTPATCWTGRFCQRNSASRQILRLIKIFPLINEYFSTSHSFSCQKLWRKEAIRNYVSFQRHSVLSCVMCRHISCGGSCHFSIVFIVALCCVLGCTFSIFKTNLSCSWEIFFELREKKNFTRPVLLLTDDEYPWTFVSRQVYRGQRSWKEINPRCHMLWISGVKSLE